MNLHQMKTQLNENHIKIFDALGIKYEIVGDNIYSTCPAHNESDNPRAFSYSISRGLWKCWTRDCQIEHKNDILGLIKAVLSKQLGYDISFTEVVSWCKTILNYNGNTTNNIKKEDIHADLSNIVSIFGSNKIINNNHQAISIDQYKIQFPSKYFIHRGFHKNTLDYFKVGDCLDMSVMRERAIIPIHDDTGENIVGIIGRTTNEYRIPKFLLYPKGFNKRFYLYNYHRALKRASETSCIFIVEGQGDVWRLYEAGVHNAISIFGKTITKEQEAKINKMPVTHLIILTDNDQSGRESKIQIKRQLGRAYKLSFPKLQHKDVGEMSLANIQKQILSQLQGCY
jgi:5S rRNA maturation endonuclease (ribonuclease M5)